ncbi:MAG: alcohol dehydrogenase [Archangium gephyra]|uniref:Alcohol dehydrogenase n=1 Tax=Archangium gephyra TaxID=48 RepID=A0A2W5UN65_9BACT|nr:MAG: alcohol dehydrogenase [Archangium gephyra]
MRALVNVKAGGPEVLQVQQRPDPMPTPGQVLIRVKRAGLNFADISARVGLYPDAPKFPMVMGYEVSGTIEALGNGVTQFAKGDRVVAMTRFGGQAEFVTAPINQVRKIPESLSFDEAAALPVNALTAFHMLHWVAPIQPGMTVLVHMAAGGVGLLAIQLCRAVPDVTVIGTSSASKHAFLKEQGVHHCIDYRTKDYVSEVNVITRNRGVDRVLDALGGPDWEKGYKLLKPGGHLCCFGWANMVDGEKRSLLRVVSQFLQLKKYSPMELMDTNRAVSGTNMGHLWEEVELMGHHLDKVLELVEQKKLSVRVDKVFPLDKAGEAHAYVQARKNIGKVLLSCD